MFLTIFFDFPFSGFVIENNWSELSEVNICHKVATVKSKNS